MWSSFTRLLDRWAMRSACGSVRPSPDGLHHGEEALELLRSENFFAPTVSVPELEFPTADKFRFPSPAISGIAANDIVTGRFARASRDWQQHPTVILLHGWNAEAQYQLMLPYWSQLLTRQGINAISFELPYHSSRRPGQPHAIRNFLSGNLHHFMSCTHQSLADARALAAWLRANGSPAVGLWGTSLGASLAGLAICHQPEFASAALLTPVVRMDRALQELPFCESIRHHAADFRDEFAPLNLVNHRLVCRPENVLVIAGRHDLFAPADTIDELDSHWHPETWRFSHGHISILVSNRVMRRIARWFREHLKASSPIRQPAATA